MISNQLICNEHPPDIDPAEFMESAERNDRVLNAYSLDQLADTDFAVDYIVAGFLAKGQPFLSAGKDKTLKSTIMLEMGICIATGTPFLGMDIVEPQPVVFLSGESGMATLKDKCRASLQAKGLSWNDASDLTLSDEIVTITSGRDLDAIERLMNERNSKLLMIDPAYLSMPGDQMSNVFGMGEILRQFAQWCIDNGITWGLTHHAKKTIIHNEPLERSDIAGAGFGEFARQWILFNHRVKPDMERGEFKLWMTWGGSAGHSGGIGLDINEGIFSSHIRDWREWSFEVLRMKDCWQAINEQQQSKADQKRKDVHKAKVAEFRPKLISALDDGPMTKNQIITRLGKSAAIWDALDELIDEKQVRHTTVSRGNNSEEYPAYEIYPTDPTDPTKSTSAGCEG